MAVTAEVDIANMALQRLGQPTISTMTESSRDASICNQLYDQNRDYCLMLCDWDCLVHREFLPYAGSVAIAGATAANPVVVTCTGHLYVDGELVTIQSVAGMTELNDNVYRVYSYTSTTITLYDTDGTTTNGSGYTAWTSGGRVLRYGGDNWVYVYDIPTDCLKVLAVLDDEFGEHTSYEWRKERTFLYTNIEDAGIKFVKIETDPTLYEADLVEVIAARLAWFVSMRVHSDKQLRAEVRAEAMSAMARARITNAEGKQDGGPPDDLWTDAR